MWQNSYVDAYTNYSNVKVQSGIKKRLINGFELFTTLMCTVQKQVAESQGDMHINHPLTNVLVVTILKQQAN